MKVLMSILVLSLFTVILYAEENVPDYLQNISVTILSGSAQGSGVIISREVEVKPNVKESVNFILTAAHVVDNLKTVRTVLDKNGKEKKVVEFKSPQTLKNLIENNRKVGEIRLDTKVIKYSDSENGDDIAVLMVLKRGVVKDSAKFLLGEDTIVPMGTRLYHVGSLLGQFGSNSMTAGIMSQVGRVLDIGNKTGVVFDQCQLGAQPGSSGGGVFKEDGTYIGMLVRGASEGFNFIVPSRRINSYFKSNNMEWVLDSKVKIPTLDEIIKIPVVDEAHDSDRQLRTEADEPFDNIVTKKLIKYN